MLKKLLPLLVLAAMVGGAWLVFNTSPEVKRSPRSDKAAMTVQTQTLRFEDYAVRISRYGRIQARQRIPLVAEASGKVIRIAPELRTSGQFKKGQLLLQLDASRYQAELAIAKAGLIESLQNYEDQQARAEQALQAWKLSGQPGEPGDRVLRKSQLSAAAAQVDSARQSVELAELDLENTRIQAPFNGRVASLNVEEGQVISSGAEVADLIADTAPEVQVALHQRDLPYLELNANMSADIRISGDSLPARFARVSPELDADSQQLMATFYFSGEDVFSGNDAATADIRVGALVEVVLHGRLLASVIAVPNRAVYQGRYVYKVVDGRLQKQQIETGWQDDDYTIVTGGLSAGDQLVVTPLGQVTSGTRVDIADTASAADRAEENQP